MAELAITRNRWVYFMVYFGIMGILLIVHLLPISIGTERLPWPDLMIMVTFAWVLRRPQYVPTTLVALVFLIADLLLMRPIGLWAALMVVGVEFLRFREPAMREQLFPLEWVTVSLLLVLLTIANRIVLALAFVPQGAFGLTVIHLVLTILTYPVIVLISRFGFNVLKMTPNETDARGRPR